MSEAPHRCWKCDYDLTGLDPSGECPECGTRIDSTRPGKENVPMALAASAIGVTALLLIPSGLLLGVFRQGSGLDLFLTLFVSATLTIPAFLLAKKAEPKPLSNQSSRPQSPYVSFAMFFALATVVVVFVIMFLSLISFIAGGLR